MKRLLQKSTLAGLSSIALAISAFISGAITTDALGIALASGIGLIATDA